MYVPGACLKSTYLGQLRSTNVQLPQVRRLAGLYCQHQKDGGLFVNMYRDHVLGGYKRAKALEDFEKKMKKKKK